MRMEQIRKQISRYRGRYEKRLMASLAAVCMVLSGGIGILLGLKQGPGIFTILLLITYIPDLVMFIPNLI